MHLSSRLSNSAPALVALPDADHVDISFEFRCVDDVAQHSDLTIDQKRAILSSWASDLFAVESCPWLRQVPGLDTPLLITDILAALRALDDEDDPPPRGGAAPRAGALVQAAA